MLKIFLTFSFLFYCSFIKAQEISVSNDRMNIFYKGIENPISIAVEGFSNKSLIVKTTNGTISKQYGYDTFHPDSIGKAEIIIYKRVQGKLKEIGRRSFRVKAIPDPVAKVGPSSGGDIQRAVLRNQQYIRANYEGIDIDVRTPIDSFSLYIISGDTCISKHVKNYTGKFSKELVDALGEIKQNDTVIFKDICTTTYDGKVKVLKPVFLFIKD